MGAILEYLKRRAASTVLVAYTIFWAILHWEGIYTTIFIDQQHILEQHHIMKNEYVNTYFFGIHWWTSGVWWELARMILPIFLAYLYVWWLPKLTNLCYRRELQFKNERRKMKLKAEADLAQATQEKVEKETEQVDAEIKLKQKEAEAQELNPESIWDIEFEKLLENEKGREALDDLKKVIYECGGSIVYNNKRQMSSDSQMICDIYGLMELDTSNDPVFGVGYVLTDKGRHFMKRFVDVVTQENTEGIDLSDIPF